MEIVTEMGYIAIDPKEDSVSECKLTIELGKQANELHSNRSERGFCKIILRPVFQPVSWRLHSNRSERGFCKRVQRSQCHSVEMRYIGIDPSEDSVSFPLIDEGMDLGFTSFSIR